MAVLRGLPPTAEAAEGASHRRCPVSWPRVIALGIVAFALWCVYSVSATALMPWSTRAAPSGEPPNAFASSLQRASLQPVTGLLVEDGATTGAASTVPNDSTNHHDAAGALSPPVAAAAAAAAAGGIRWIGTECDSRDIVRIAPPPPDDGPPGTGTKSTTGKGVLKYDRKLCEAAAAGPLGQPIVAGEPEHRCIFWNRAVFTQPRSAASLRTKLERRRRRRSAYPGCTLEQLTREAATESSAAPTGEPIIPTGALRFQKMAASPRDSLRATSSTGAPLYELAVDGCDVDTGLLDAPDALLATLWTLSDEGARPIVFTGDSVVRQIATTFLYALRGRRHHHDHGDEDASAPQPVIEHASDNGWQDWVYVVRRLDDEYRVITTAASHYPSEGERHRFEHGPGVTDAERTRCVDHSVGDNSSTSAHRTIDPAPPRERGLQSFFSTASNPDGAAAEAARGERPIRQCVRAGGGEAEANAGPVWCDRAHPTNPCLLRLYFVWSNHEGFARDADAARGRHFTFASKHAAEDDGYAVDCGGEPGRPVFSPEPPARRDTVTDVPEWHSPPMRLPYSEIPAFHVTGYTMWAPMAIPANTGPRSDTSAVLRFAADVSNFILGRFWSWAARVRMPGLACALGDAAAPPEPPPPYRAVWLTGPKLRDEPPGTSSSPPAAGPGRSRKRAFTHRGNGMIPPRSRRLKRALLDNFSLATVRADASGGSRASSVDPWIANRTGPIHQRRFAHLADFAGLIETLPADVRGTDGIHWQCQQRIPQRAPCDLIADDRGCPGDIHRGVGLLLAAIADAMLQPTDPT